MEPAFDWLDQQRRLADFIRGLSEELGAPVVAVSQNDRLVSDPSFSHWIVVDGHIIGEAREVTDSDHGVSTVHVRLFAAPECAEYGSVEDRYLLPKGDGTTT